MARRKIKVKHLVEQGFAGTCVAAPSSAKLRQKQNFSTFPLSNLCDTWQTKGYNVAFSSLSCHAPTPPPQEENIWIDNYLHRKSFENRASRWALQWLRNPKNKGEGRLHCVTSERSVYSHRTTETRQNRRDPDRIRTTAATMVKLPAEERPHACALLSTTLNLKLGFLFTHSTERQSIVVWKLFFLRGCLLRGDMVESQTRMQLFSHQPLTSQKFSNALDCKVVSQNYYMQK